MVTWFLDIYIHSKRRIVQYTQMPKVTTCNWGPQKPTSYILWHYKRLNYYTANIYEACCNIISHTYLRYFKYFPTCIHQGQQQHILYLPMTRMHQHFIFLTKKTTHNILPSDEKNEYKKLYIRYLCKLQKNNSFKEFSNLYKLNLHLTAAVKVIVNWYWLV